MMQNSVISLFAGFALSLSAHGARADCLDDAARYHRVSARVVRAIAQGESSMRANALNVNEDGSEDIGLMQVNSWWFPKLARYGITREKLFDACVNAYVGTWIFASNVKKYGATWKAVGAYNAASPQKQLVYANKIYRLIMRSPH